MSTFVTKLSVQLKGKQKNSSLLKWRWLWKVVTSLEKTKLCWMHLPSQMSVLWYKPWWLCLPLHLFFFLSLLQLQHALLQNRIISAREIKHFSCYKAGSFLEAVKLWLAA